MESKDNDLLNDLVIESREHLAEIEPDLLALEKGTGADTELLNRIFRAVHSIKGGFGFFGMEKIKQLSHAMENVLDRMRTGKLSISPELTDVLLKGIDLLRAMIEDPAASESMSIDEMLERLKPFQQNNGETPKPAAGPKTIKTEASGNLSRDALKQAVRSGKCIYSFTFQATPAVLSERVSAWQQISQILEITPDPASLSTNAISDFQVTVASVLEPDLIAAGLELPEEQIRQVDVTTLKKEAAEERKKTAESAEKKKAGVEGEGADLAKLDSQASETLRVRVNLLNNLMTLAGELVLSRNQLLQNLGLKLDELLDADKILRMIEQSLRDSCTALFSRYENHLPMDDRKLLQEALQKEVARNTQVIAQTLGVRMSELKGLSGLMQNIDRVTSEMQENIMQTRLQPVGVVFGKFPRVVRDLARELGKVVNLNISGADVELDKSIIELLSDPLNHIIRNSVDHGVETPSDREEQGKLREGTITLRAYHSGGKVLIEVVDDGAGIDLQRVRDKALEKNLISHEDAKRMTEKELTNLIFLPGFSTAKVVSEVSGRGVGMDVVKTNIERLGGTVEIESTLGKGSRIIMQLPLTLAIIPSLIISVEERCFAIPQVGLDELVRIRARDVASRIESVHGSPVLRLRGKLLPLVRLSDVFGMRRTFADPGSGERAPDKRERLIDRRETPASGDKEAEKRQNGDRRQSRQSSVKVVVLKAGENRFGLMVDEVHDSEEIIVKPLSSYLKKCTCYAGSAIMGDGRVAMILDPAGISSLAGLRFTDLEKESLQEKERHARSLLVEDQEMLTFRNGGSEVFAVDLSMVARVEQIPASAIERIGGKEYLKYEDRSLRLIRLDQFMPVGAPESAPKDYFIIVPKLVRHPLGILATHVEDVIHAKITVDRKNVTGTGIFGSAVVDKKMFVLLDVYGLFEAAEPELYAAQETEVFSGKRVLLAEDTNFFRNVEEHYLRSFGFQIDTAKDGEEAWQKLGVAGASYDILITDIEMPVMNGLDLMRKIKESGRYKQMPIVMLTALNSSQTREKGVAAGADACESKLDKEQLRNTLRGLLTR